MVKNWIELPKSTFKKRGEIGKLQLKNLIQESNVENPIKIHKLESFDDYQLEKDKKSPNKNANFSNTISENISGEMLGSESRKNRTFDQSDFGETQDHLGASGIKLINKKDSTQSVRPILKTSQEFFTKRAGIQKR